jgi:hypothetical protein
MMDPVRFQKAIEAFDRANAEDPHTIVGNEATGVEPRELVQARRLSAWVKALAPNASEALSLAAHCQHIRRWQVPREAYPAGRVGYLQWRTRLARFHADTAAQLLQSVGYEQELIDAVRRINLKQNLRSNPDSQTMEDALCLSFLEHELEEFSAKYPAEKVVEVVQKTWQKMSEQARERALTLPFSAGSLALIQRALAPVA